MLGRQAVEDNLY